MNIIIVGATSGLGYETAKIYLEKGYNVGLAGRRVERLSELQSLYPNTCYIEKIDVTKEESIEALESLIDQMGGMDLFFLSSGVGKQNRSLEADIEMNTVATNVEGFTRMMIFTFNYFSKREKGHIAAISSIAGTKGIGISASYSATKRFQNTYMEALEQLARGRKLDITFTDIRPGFVDTDLLADRNYPMLMNVEKTAKHIVKSIESKKRVVIVDYRYKMIVGLWRLIPKKLWVRIKL